MHDYGYLHFYFGFSLQFWMNFDFWHHLWLLIFLSLTFICVYESKGLFSVYRLYGYSTTCVCMYKFNSVDQTVAFVFNISMVAAKVLFEKSCEFFQSFGYWNVCHQPKSLKTKRWRWKYAYGYVVKSTSVWNTNSSSSNRSNDNYVKHRYICVLFVSQFLHSHAQPWLTVCLNSAQICLFQYGKLELLMVTFKF